MKYKNYTIDFIKHILKENETISARKLGKQYGFNHTLISYWKRTINKRVEKTNIENVISFLKKNNKVYSYVLGIYFGDGYICKTSRTWALRISMDKRYDSLNQYVIDLLYLLFPNNKITKISLKGCWEFKVYSNMIPEMFPHLGKGMKHERYIMLQDWQSNLIDPVCFVQGLFHSDGCCYMLQKKYLSFSFSNKSTEIKQFWIYYCNLLGIQCSYKNIENKNIYVYGKFAKQLYDLIGNKQSIVNLFE